MTVEAAGLRGKQALMINNESTFPGLNQKLEFNSLE